MKKLFVFLIVSVIMLNSFGFCTVYADNDETRAVLAMVKDRIPGTSDFDNFESSIRTYASSVIYSFNWTTQNEESNKYMNLSATPDGIITSFYYNDDSVNDNSSHRVTVNKKTSDEVMPDAEKLVYKLNPGLRDKIKISSDNIYESLTDTGYSYALQRIENGIPVYGDTGYVTVNSDCTIIQNFNLSYTQNLKFDSTERLITVDKAKEIYASELPLELVYQSSRESDDDTACLYYVDDTDGKFVDALSGTVYKPVGAGRYMYLESPKNESFADSAAGAFTPAELEELENVEGLLTVDDITAVLKQNKYVKISSDMTADLRYRSKNDSDEYICSIYYESANHDYASVVVNARSGEIISLNQSYDDYPDESVSEDIAKDIIAYMTPTLYSVDESGEYRLCESTDNNSFTFVRYINDIPFYENTIRVGINPADNTITNYSLNHNKSKKFSNHDSVIGAAEACAKLFEQVDYELVYYPCASDENVKANDIAKLLYMTEPSTECILDADSGKLLKFYETDVIGDYTDISGHYAENTINTLSRFGIGFAENEFRPDDTITQKDFISLIPAVVGAYREIILTKDYPYNQSYNYAQSHNIISADEKAPDSPVTREKACIYMIRALGLEAAAELDGIYVSQFEDVNENIGYISILSAMGVVNGYNGMFNPDAELSRADAMIMLCNYLK